VRSASFVVVVVALLGAALGCSGKESPSSSDAGGDGAPVDTSACEDDTSATPATCQACVTATCSDTWNACLADPACVAEINCISGCATAACEKQCQTDHPSANGDAVLTCLRGPCKNACTQTICG
jgi:hypothetical protein